MKHEFFLSLSISIIHILHNKSTAMNIRSLICSAKKKHVKLTHTTVVMVFKKLQRTSFKLQKKNPQFSSSTPKKYSFKSTHQRIEGE